MTPRPILTFRKLDPNTPAPSYANYGDSGLDLFSRVDCIAWPFRTVRIPLGISVDIPAGHEMQIRPRSSWSKVSWLQNVGTIDNGYKGELVAQIYNASFLPRKITKGMKVAQAVVAPVAYCRIMAEITVPPAEGSTLPPTVRHREIDQPEPKVARGEKGFGSSGA